MVKFGSIGHHSTALCMGFGDIIGNVLVPDKIGIIGVPNLTLFVICPSKSEIYYKILPLLNLKRSF